MRNVKPILMRPELVRETLGGRKNQTRRVVKPQPTIEQGWEDEPGWAYFWKDMENGLLHHELVQRCPYGRKGDLLYVREAMKADYDTTDTAVLGRYVADDSHVLYSGPEVDENGDDDYGGSMAHWDYSRDVCPGIHMRRSFSRLTLEIAAIDIARVQDITAEDCIGEGIEPVPGRPDLTKEKFAELWDSINGGTPFAWDRNPWVWVVRYVPHVKNVDDFLRGIAA